MIKTRYPLIVIALLFAVFAKAQVAEVRYPVKFDVSPPLRDLAKVHHKRIRGEHEKEVPNYFDIFNTSPGPVLPDPAIQVETENDNMAAAITPFVIEGLNNQNNTSGVTPPDPSGDVGPNHYLQVVNSVMRIYDRATGAILLPAQNTSTIWNGFSTGMPFDGHNDGDAIVLYDENADRWLISQFAVDCSPQISGVYQQFELVAISATSDPTGSWYRYAFSFDLFPDYPKLGVWNDGYYLAVNRFGTVSFTGAGACVLDRTKMLAGDPTASMIYFKCETLGGSGDASGTACYSMLPSDCDGTMPPSGTPNYFTYVYNSSTSGADRLRIWKLTTNWITPASSTFQFVQAITLSDYTPYGSGGQIPQLGSTIKLDALSDRLMNRLQYRNMGTYQSMVTCHTTNTGSGAGVRWYELRFTGSGVPSTWTKYQESTYAPGDGQNRWLGSVAMNASGDIALGYTVSSSTLYPSIRFTGRKSTDALNSMTITESSIVAGAYPMVASTYTRWGDYAMMSVDPTDNQTFWHTNEYAYSNASWPWGTKIASFKFASTPIVTTTAATLITGTTATLNGTVNPNGLATNYHFEYGTSTSYGTNTSTLSAGSGSSNVVVSSNITGLTSGVPVHFRLVAVNSEGTTNGNDLLFTPGAAQVTTTAASAIAQTTATSGGNITSDGGSAVTARGVCWATTANPVATGNHTIDGSGTGTFTSSITGLVANTLYHVRAYATNTNGTYYGEDLIFTTLCGVSTLPLAENFTLSTLPSCWTTQISGSGAVDKWTVSNSNTAGGSAYEMMSTYQNISSAVTRLVTIPFNTIGMLQLNLSFKHMLDAYGTGCTLRVQSSTDGITWTNEAWSVASTTTNITATTVNTTVLNNLNSANTMIAFTIEGNLYQYDYWYIDEVNISSPLPTVTTTAATSVTATTASSGGNVTAQGSSSVTARGVCWATTANPVATGNHTTDGTGTGVFTSSVTGLTANTPYHVRAYATNSSGTSYGADLQFTTAIDLPTVTTTTPTSITPTTASSGGNVTADGGGTITARGVCWSTTANPIVTGSHTTDGSGTGVFTSSITGLSANTPYHVRAYATNSAGTSYGADLQFTTAIDLPTVTTTTPTSITPTTASSGGNVTGAGGGTITARGVCWSTTANPIATGNHTTDGSGTGAFTSSITGLTANTPYHVRAYATNSAGTSYGADLQFTSAALTLSVTPTNQDVPATSGTTSFSLTSNSAWSVSSDQSWCTVTPSGSGNGTVYANYDANTLVSSRVANITVTVSGLSPVTITVTQAGLPDKVLNLTVLLEGLFNGTTMNQAMNTSGHQFSGNTADQITVELHNSTSPFALAGGPYTVNVNTDGTASVTVSGILSSSYYIVVKHRNSIETWNGSPVSFSGASMSYNFSSSASQAYGNNLKQVSGKYVIYSGDIDQNGVINANDISSVDAASASFANGYIPADLNGDGIVDGADLILLDNNSALFIAKVTP